MIRPLFRLSLAGYIFWTSAVIPMGNEGMRPSTPSARTDVVQCGSTTVFSLFRYHHDHHGYHHWPTLRGTEYGITPARIDSIPRSVAVSTLQYT